jgi:carboxymethylenebutenolidase
MRITIFGAAGSVGSRVVAEALSRGHDVTAVVRRESHASSIPVGTKVRFGDASSVEQVTAFSTGEDVVISATRPSMGREQDLVATARALLTGVARSGTRLILVGGAATLTVPKSGRLVVDDSQYLPAAARDIALACGKQLETCIASTQADWTYLSPPAMLVPGERSGHYRLGRDELLVDFDGRSRISIEDFAVALLDEAESPKHRRLRFTVAESTLAVDEREVMVKTSDGTADCYLVHPTSGIHPGVIVWPDVLGLRATTRTTGKRLAQRGYSVLVVNPFYRETAAPIDVDATAFTQPEGRERAMRYARAITPDMTMRDAVAFASYLDQQASVDHEQKLATTGYCVGGAMTFRAAAALPQKIAAIAAFHGSRLVTSEPSSPHLLIPSTRANALIAIAENDDADNPQAKTVLREAYRNTDLAAEIEVYVGSRHGWCVPDAKFYDPMKAEHAWSRLLVLLSKALSRPTVPDMQDRRF